MYKKALRFDPSNASYTGNLGWSYYLCNDNDKCIEYSLKATKADSTAYFARFNLGLAYLRSGDILKARQIYSGLKKDMNSISYQERDGAIKDLLDLKAKGIYVPETNAILKEFFNYL
ncbi:MAG TPA: hypothetical protein VMT63_07920 [Bacteroidales bacterium]|nr:hypothetical protein [Bacteroidales bacterium]